MSDKLLEKTIAWLTELSKKEGLHDGWHDTHPMAKLALSIIDGEKILTPFACWFCAGQMIWGGDHSFEDYGWEGRGDGVIANLSCAECEATAYMISKPDGDEPPPSPL